MAPLIVDKYLVREDVKGVGNMKIVFHGENTETLACNTVRL